MTAAMLRGFEDFAAPKVDKDLTVDWEIKPGIESKASLIAAKHKKAQAILLVL